MVVVGGRNQAANLKLALAICACTASWSGMNERTTAFAQEAGSPGAPHAREDTPPTSEWNFVISPSGRYAFTTDVDGNNGDFNVWRGGFDVKAIGPLNEHARLLLGASYEINSYEFSGPNSFVPGTTEPFENVHIARLTTGLQGAIDQNWSWNVGVGYEYAGEAGAEVSDASSVFGWIRADTQIDEQLAIGIGVLVKSQIEDDALVLPAAGVRWQIDENFRLVVEGPGAELSTEISEGLRFGVGAAYESRRFRISDGPIQNSRVIDDTGVPIFARLQFDPNPRSSFSIETGAIVFQEFEIENQFGAMRRTFETDPTPYVGIRMDIRF